MVAYDYADPRAAGTDMKMPILKEVASSSTVAWCPLEPNKNLLASGTVSGTIDDSFQTSSRLMILNTSLENRSLDMPILGQARVKDADFVRIGWGAKGSSDSTMPLGLIAGGMSDGSVLLWSAKAILEGQNRNPIVAKRHGSHVSGLAFHPSEQNLIASGSADSELLIWDLKNLSAPTASPPGTSGSAEKSSVVDIAWNLKVAHILACSTSNGQTNVWDLRQKRAVITFTESTHRHIPATAVAWDPTQARQLVVSYAHPSAEVWDLRYGMAPKQMLNGGHSRGSILTVAWPEYDSNVIVTTGEDVMTCIWNASDGQLLDSVHDRGTTFCMKWHPFVPELLAGSTYEGNVSIRSISNTGSHIPAWKGRPCGATFGFGSRLVSFGNGFTPGTVRCHKVSTDPEFIRIASEFHRDISQIDLRTFCSQRIAYANGDEDEKTTWEFLRLMFEGDARFKFLQKLGFTPSFKAAAASLTTAIDDNGRLSVQRLDDVSDEDFFNQLSPDQRTSTLTHDGFGMFKPSSPLIDALSISDSVAADTEEEASPMDTKIGEMLIIGDIAAAAKFCAQNNLMADALLIASLGSAELQMEIQSKFINTHRKHYIRSIANCINSKDIVSYAQRSQLDRWKETLALMATYSDPDQFIPVVRVLVGRLEEAGMAQAAIICCLVCSDIDGAAIQWQKQEHTRTGKSRIDILQSSVEKLYVMSQACGETCGPSACGLYSEYAGLLSAQGAMSTALSFLQFAGSKTDELSYRIYYSGVPLPSFEPPPQPFYIQRVQGSAPATDRMAAPGPGRPQPPCLRRPAAPDLQHPGSIAAAPRPRIPPGASRRLPIQQRPPSSPTYLASQRPSSLPPQPSTSLLPSRHLTPSSIPGRSPSPGPTRFAPPGRRPMSNGPTRSPQLLSSRAGPFDSRMRAAPLDARRSLSQQAPGPSPPAFDARTAPIPSRPQSRDRRPSQGPVVPPPSLPPFNLRGAAPRPSSGAPFDLRGAPRTSPGASFDARVVPRPSPGASFDARGAPRPSSGQSFELRAAPRPSQSLDPRAASRPSFESRATPRPPFDPRAAPRPSPGPSFDPRAAPRPPFEPRAASRPSFDSRVAPRPSFDPRAGPRPSYDSLGAAPRPSPGAPFDPRGATPSLPSRPSPSPPFPARPSPRGLPASFSQAPLDPRRQIGAQSFPSWPPSQPTSFEHRQSHPTSFDARQPQPTLYPGQPHRAALPSRPPMQGTRAAHDQGRPVPRPGSAPQYQPDAPFPSRTVVSGPPRPARPAQQVAQQQHWGQPSHPVQQGNGWADETAFQGTAPTQRPSSPFLRGGPPHTGAIQQPSSPPQPTFQPAPPQQTPSFQGSLYEQALSARTQRPSSSFQEGGTPHAGAMKQPPSPPQPAFQLAPPQQISSLQETRQEPPVHLQQQPSSSMPFAASSRPLSPARVTSPPPSSGPSSSSPELVARFVACFDGLYRQLGSSDDAVVIARAREAFADDLYGRISSGALSPAATTALSSLAKALEAQSKSGVQQANINLITNCWGEVKNILPHVKAIVDLCKKTFV